MDFQNMNDYLEQVMDYEKSQESSNNHKNKRVSGLVA